MMGQGIIPKAYHPVATKLLDDELNQLLAGLRDSIDKTVASLPPHHDYVARYCGEVGAGTA